MTIIHTFEASVALVDVRVTPSRETGQSTTQLGETLLRALNLAHTGRETVSFDVKASDEHKASHSTLAREVHRQRRVRVGLHRDGTLELLGLVES